MAQNTKDGSGNTPIGARKTSVSAYSNASGTLSRPGTRRRDTSDSFTAANGLLSPTESKTFFQQNAATPPPALLRRRTDFKEEEDPSPEQRELAKDEGGDSHAAFGSLRRIGTAPVSQGIGASATSPWSAGPSSSGFGNMGSFGSFNVPSAQDSEKRPGFGSARGSSRFKDLLAKTSTEDMSTLGKDKVAFSGLEKLPEEDTEAAARMRDMFRTRPNRSETNPYDDAPARTGSAAMSASQDGGASIHGIESMGFSAFGSAARDYGGDGYTNQTRYSANEPLSPANTNPYQSPPGPRHDDEEHQTNDAPQQSLPPFGGARRNLFDTEPTNRAFGGLPGFGPWSSAGLGSGTSARAVSSSAFADPIFSPLSDLQSPSAGLGGGFFGGGGGAFGAPGRSSRLGAMFPPAMQEQMRSEARSDLPPPFSSRPESAHQDIGPRDPFDSTFARGSGAFGGLEDATPRASEGAPGFGAPGGSGIQQPVGAPSAGQRASTGSDPELAQAVQDGSMPAAQQRQMVMPDRMRWIYRDPQGTIQGPWSGLEMHDWFKAGFFTAELLVKKVEDTDFEPLAQLVRRIGNSREPFLVPQIGVPHGPSSTTTWPNPATAAQGPAPPPSGNAQPPFASAFPSFGTTLTAEQQNALERRKQEEQYLMARQKEHLAQQQVFMRQQQIQTGPHGAQQGLQHHSSQHSLHSQPSFGSIASPHPAPFQSPMPQIPSHQPIGPPPTSSGSQAPQFGREEGLPSFMDRLSFNERMSFPHGAPLGAPGEGVPGMTQTLQDRARLQQQQQQSDMRAHQDAFLGPQGRNDRLEEFNELRGQAEVGLPAPEHVLPTPIGAQRNVDEQNKQPAPIGHSSAVSRPAPFSRQDDKASLTEQIQRTAEWQEQQPLQFPPQSITPLPAPTAQRNRKHVADNLVPEPRSETQTPVETPSTSLAPWAQQPAEGLRGPSLKEIQEAEAKKAAEAEALAAEVRRIAAEQERIAAANLPPPAPGLPLSSTWGQTSSPGTPTTASAPSAWGSKPAVKQVASNTGKKTLAQIQKEEEARKKRQVAAVAATAAQAQNTAVGIQGTRYADLAGKSATASSPTTVPSVNPSTAAWTTVGSGGKAKAPAGAPATIVATPQPGLARAVSGSAPAKKPSLTTAKSSTGLSADKQHAEAEFRKWLRGQLSKNLNRGIEVDDFVNTLVSLPAEPELIADSVYSASQLLDGRRIAEEFVKRKKLAEKGIVVENGSAGGDGAKTGAGWNEVAKKGPEKVEQGNGVGAGRREEFKVVSGKKKGKK